MILMKRIAIALAGVPLLASFLTASPLKTEQPCPFDCPMWNFPDIDRFFDRPIMLRSSFISSMKETEKGYLVSIDMPGIEKKDIKLETSANRITVTGERKDETETKEKSKRSYALFKQSYQLPDDADLDRIGAELKNGVLKLTVPKNGKKRVKHIDIK